MPQAIHIATTGDISLEELRQLTARPDSHVLFEIDPRQGFFKSVDAPSWIKFLQEPQFWIQTLAGGLALDLVKSSARRLWRQRAVVKSIAREGMDLALTEFAETLAVLRAHYGAATELFIGVPVPSDWFATGLVLEGDDPSLMASQVALFLAHLPGIEELLERHKTTLLGQLSLTLTGEGDIIAEWTDRDAMVRRREVLTFRDVV